MIPLVSLGKNPHLIVNGCFIAGYYFHGPRPIAYGAGGYFASKLLYELKPLYNRFINPYIPRISYGVWVKSAIIIGSLAVCFFDYNYNHKIVNALLAGAVYYSGFGLATAIDKSLHPAPPPPPPPLLPSSFIFATNVLAGG